MATMTMAASQCSGLKSHRLGKSLTKPDSLVSPPGFSLIFPFLLSNQALYGDSFMDVPPPPSLGPSPFILVYRNHSFNKEQLNPSGLTIF